MTLGSDSHAVIDLLEEARAVELDERLASGVRGSHDAPSLLRAATAQGHQSLGWPEAGRIEPGALADLTTIALDSVRTAGGGPEHAIEMAVFAATAADVHHVVIGGRVVVADGRHVSIDVPAELAACCHDTVVDGIGLLVTNADEGELVDAWLVFDNEHVVSRRHGSRPRTPTSGSLSAGRCVIPGFVDSHTHLVFAGDRSAEFAARMAGAPYAAGGINVTIAATREASDDALATARRDPPGGVPPGGHHDGRDQVGLRRNCRRRGTPPAHRSHC